MNHNDDFEWKKYVCFPGSAIVFLMIRNKPEKTNSVDQQSDLA